MELKEIVINLNKHKLTLLASVLVGIFLGYLFYTTPKNYHAVGSFYVKRAADTTKFKYFSYDGYYAQQTGLSYTNTILALFESTDVINEALKKINLSTDINNFKKYSRMIQAKKTGPQIITLTVKGKTRDEAKSLWNSLTDTTINKNKEINKDGDSELSVSKIMEEPVLKEQYRPLWMCLVLGGIFVPTLVIFFLGLKDYSKWK